jgi:vancomycin resistance protein YoaR
LEQAARTSKFVADFGTRGGQPSPSFADVLDLSVDADHRIEAISCLTEGSGLTPGELNCLLLQEVALTNALRRYSQRVQEDLRESREALRAIAKTLRCQESDLSPATVAKRLSLKLVQAKQAGGRTDWTEWGQNLYEALTGIDPGRVPPSDIQIAIEESALTSVGNPRVQTLVHRSQRRTRRV